MGVQTPSLSWIQNTSHSWELGCPVALPWALCDPVYSPIPNLHNPHWVVLRTGRAKGVSGSRNSGCQGSRYGYGERKAVVVTAGGSKYHPKPQVHCLAQKLPQVQALGTTGRRSSCGYGSHVCTLNLCRSGRGWQGPRPAP